MFDDERVVAATSRGVLPKLEWIGCRFGLIRVWETPRVGSGVLIREPLSVGVLFMRSISETVRRISLAVLAAVASIAAVAPIASANEASRLTEGVGLPGVLELGQSRQSVVNTLSAPQCSSGSPCFLATAGPGGFVEVRFTNDRVSVLAFENSHAGWSTTAGVTPDSTGTDVANIYPDAVVYGRTVAVDSRGYAARTIRDTICNDTGCYPSGQHLRHFIFDPGLTNGGEAAFNGDVSYTSDRNRVTRPRIYVDVFDSSGDLVATGSTRVRVGRRATVTLDPGQFVDINQLEAGRYTYEASRGAKRRNTNTGSFSVVTTGGSTETPYPRT